MALTKDKKNELVVEVTSLLNDSKMTLKLVEGGKHLFVLIATKTTKAD